MKPKDCPPLHRLAEAMEAIACMVLMCRHVPHLTTNFYRAKELAKAHAPAMKAPSSCATCAAVRDALAVTCHHGILPRGSYREGHHPEPDGSLCASCAKRVRDLLQGFRYTAGMSEEEAAAVYDGLHETFTGRKPAP